MSMMFFGIPKVAKALGTAAMGKVTQMGKAGQMVPTDEKDRYAA